MYHTQVFILQLVVDGKEKSSRLDTNGDVFSSDSSS